MRPARVRSLNLPQPGSPRRQALSEPGTPREALPQLAWAHSEAVGALLTGARSASATVGHKEVALTTEFCYLGCKCSVGERGERRWRYEAPRQRPVFGVGHRGEVMCSPTPHKMP